METKQREGVEDVRESVFLHLKNHHRVQIIFLIALFVFIEFFLFFSADKNAMLLPFGLLFLTLGYLWFVARTEIEQELWKEFAGRSGYIFGKSVSSQNGKFADSLFLDFNSKWTKTSLVSGKFEEHPISFFLFRTPVSTNDPDRETVFTVCETTILQKVPSVVISRRFPMTAPVYLFTRTFPNHTKLTLEGDFNKFFTVHVATGKERDLLEMLTPDVMEKLLEYSELFSFEFYEDRLFVIAEKCLLKRNELDAMNDAARYLVEKVPGYFTKSS
jgi:hypothetical protein